MYCMWKLPYSLPSSPSLPLSLPPSPLSPLPPPSLSPSLPSLSYAREGVVMGAALIVVFNPQYGRF